MNWFNSRSQHTQTSRRHSIVFLWGQWVTRAHGKIQQATSSVKVGSWYGLGERNKEPSKQTGGGASLSPFRSRELAQHRAQMFTKSQPWTRCPDFTQSQFSETNPILNNYATHSSEIRLPMNIKCATKNTPTPFYTFWEMWQHTTFYFNSPYSTDLSSATYNSQRNHLKKNPGRQN